MMPDLTQHGTAETKEWTPVQNAPVIMFDRVSKSYGRINALNSISLGISGGVTGILGMNGAGKSTLFNRLTSSKKALVADVPGLTRDTKVGFATRGDSSYVVIDTGGIERRQKEPLQLAVEKRAFAVAKESDYVLFVLDGRDGSDVDIVIQDTGLEKDNPEFKDASGNSRVKYIIVDCTAHIDPTYFSNNSSKTYIDWWENSSNRSTQFQSIGTLTVPRFTVLLYLNYGSDRSSTYFSQNIGKTIIQTIGGSEYTRGKIVDSSLIYEGIAN